MEGDDLVLNYGFVMVILILCCVIGFILGFYDLMWTGELVLLLLKVRRDGRPPPRGVL